MEAVARGKRASENQKEYLVNYLEEHDDLAKDKFVTADGAKHREKKWNELAASLNALGGTQKDGIRWKKYWSDLRLNTRGKYSAIKQDEQRSGINGLSRKKALSPLEERIIQITTLEAVDGDKTAQTGFEKTIASCRQSGDSAEYEPICEVEFEDVEFLDSNTAAPTTSGNAGARPRKRQQRGQPEGSQLQKLYDIEERKVFEMERANCLKEIQIEAIKANTQAQERVMAKLSELLSSLATRE